MVNIIDATEVHPLSIRQNARRYKCKNQDYEKALKPYIGEFREKMKDMGKYEYVIVSENRIKDILGFPINTFSMKTIIENIKIVLFKYDMVVKVERSVDGKRLFNLRRRYMSDTLPQFQQTLENNERPKSPRM